MNFILGVDTKVINKKKLKTFMHSVYVQDLIFTQKHTSKSIGTIEYADYTSAEEINIRPQQQQ